MVPAPRRSFGSGGFGGGGSFGGSSDGVPSGYIRIDGKLVKLPKEDPIIIGGLSQLLAEYMGWL